MREAIAPLWKGNGPLHFHPHIQVSLSSRSGEFWTCLSCTLSFVKCSFAAFQFPRTMYSCPQVSASLQPGTLTLSRVRCLWSLKLQDFLLLLSPEINEWLSFSLRTVQGWNGSSLLYSWIYFTRCAVVGHFHLFSPGWRPVGIIGASLMKMFLEKGTS